MTTETFEKALDLLDLGYTFPSITEETGITTENGEAVHVAWFNGRRNRCVANSNLLACWRLRQRGCDPGRAGAKPRRATCWARFCTFIENM
jgi:hypothetical protein